MVDFVSMRVVYTKGKFKVGGRALLTDSLHASPEIHKDSYSYFSARTLMLGAMAMACVGAIFYIIRQVRVWYSIKRRKSE